MREFHTIFDFSEADRFRFNPRFMPPVVLPTFPRRPWQRKSLIFDSSEISEVYQLLRSKIANGVLEPSRSVYSSSWFVIRKKPDGGLRLIQDLSNLFAWNSLNSSGNSFS